VPYILYLKKQRSKQKINDTTQNDLKKIKVHPRPKRSSSYFERPRLPELEDRTEKTAKKKNTCKHP
jgi:hypothetical protein